ncbi:MAG: hypothetical protein ABII63_05970 [Pseudomonadota bacterium]
MLLHFANEAQLLQALQMSMFWGALVVVVTTVLMTASLQGTKSEIRNSTAVMLGCLFYLLFGILTYREQYGSFTAAEVDSQHITLQFAGHYFEPQTFEAGQVAAIKADRPGKGETRQCYLNLILVSGESYRSAPASDVDCEAYRQQIATLLGR